MQTVEQWAYGAILDYWVRWNAARRSVRRKRPLRSGSAAIAFALAAATSVTPQMRYNRGP